MKFLQSLAKSKVRLGTVALVAALSANIALSRPVQAQSRTWATGLTNIAAAANGGRIINVSSTIDNDAKFAATNLIDGKVYNADKKTGSFGWASDKYDPVNMEYVTIGFKDNSLHTIGKIVINPAASVAPERWVKDVEVEASTESAEGPYQVVAQLTVLKKGEPQEFTILPAPARFVRLLFRTNYGSDRAVALGEVEIYEAVNPTDGLGGLISRMEGAVNELKQYRQAQADTGGTTVADAASDNGVTNAALTSSNHKPGKPQLSEATLQLIQQNGGNPATASAASPRNIAAAQNGGRVVDFSSTFVSDPAKGADPVYSPDNLIDGDVFREKDNAGSFGWASQGFAPGKQYVTIGFRGDRTHVINRIVVNPSSNQSSLRWARRIDVQVTTESSKTGPWQTVATLNLRLEPVNQEFKIPSIEAKYVRFVFMANGPGDVKLPGIDQDVNSDRSVSLGEIEIYEPAAESAALDSVIGHLQQILVDLKRLYEQQGKNT
ncbi:MAG: discoidin domain-containing protein [Abitibacteriaceae bacterium]|nr:discoidin domain-containing protein [Abditibacteriaceae bacterium]